MKHEEIVALIMKRFNNQKLYNILKKWDENKTIIENSIEAGVSNYYARNLVVKYNLKFVPHFAVRKRHYVRKKSLEYLKNWDSKKSLKENADKLAISVSRACQIANNYGLSWTKYYKSGAKLLFQCKSNQMALRDSMKELASKGLSNTQIGKVFEITNERVRQILI